MTTKMLKKRINISATKEMSLSIAYLAKRDGSTVTTKATELIHSAIELEEDMALATIANARMATGKKYLTHEHVWKSRK